jgi:hypothetical protein
MSFKQQNSYHSVVLKRTVRELLYDNSIATSDVIRGNKIKKVSTIFLLP